MAGNYSQLLADFHTAYNSIDQVKPLPKTTLEIVKDHYDEDHWNRLLTYFLDSSNPHGFGIDVLSTFLTVIEAECDSFYFDRHRVDDIRIMRELSTPNNNRADIVLRYETDWFLWIEIKVRSSEGNQQTKSYVSDDHVGNVEKSKFEEGSHYYVYLAPEGNSPKNDEFVDLDWSQVLDAFRPIQQAGVSEYPFRSYAQFTDFLDTIENEIDMTQHEENQREKVELAIKYYDAIEDVSETFEEVIQTHQEEWPARFEPHAPSSWEKKWGYHSGKKSLSFFKKDWIIGEISPDGTVDSDVPLRPYFQHVLSTDLIGSGKLRFKTQLTGSNSEFKEEFQDYIYSDDSQRRLQAMVQDIEKRHSCEVKIPDRDDKKYTRFSIIDYSFEWQGGEGYYQKLRQALDDHQEAIKIYDEAIERIDLD